MHGNPSILFLLISMNSWVKSLEKQEFQPDLKAVERMMTKVVIWTTWYQCIIIYKRQGKWNIWCSTSIPFTIMIVLSKRWRLYTSEDKIPKKTNWLSNLMEKMLNPVKSVKRRQQTKKIFRFHYIRSCLHHSTSNWLTPLPRTSKPTLMRKVTLES